MRWGLRRALRADGVGRFSDFGSVAWQHRFQSAMHWPVRMERALAGGSEYKQQKTNCCSEVAMGRSDFAKNSHVFLFI